MNRADIRNFPYPFKENIYRYSNNSIPLEVPNSIEITAQYSEEMELKRNLLYSHPQRCFQALSHSKLAQWEIVELIADHLVTYYPDKFTLMKEGNNWTFMNHILAEEHTFRFGDNTSIPSEPLDFIGRHVQEDLLLMGQRDGNLYLEAGQLCFPANWSLAFDLGMSFKEIHHPIPGFKGEGLDDRILNFLIRIEAGNPWGRKNWSLMAGNRLDTSLETFDEWGKGRKQVTKDNAGQLVHLRVEDQKLFRLPQSNSLLFTIHTHLLPLEKLAKEPDLFKTFYEILVELPDFIVSYKGLSLFKHSVIEYMKNTIESWTEI